MPEINCTTCNSQLVDPDLEPCKTCFEIKDNTGKIFSQWSPRLTTIELPDETWRRGDF
jgi:hypothetical protein